MNAARQNLRVIDDEALMARVQGDEAGAFALLYERHAVAALHVVRTVLPGRAQDALQDGFLSVWRSRGTYRPELGAVRAWILTIVRRRALDLARSESRRLPTSEGKDFDSIPAAGCLEDDMIAQIDGEALQMALRQLTGVQREVIVLAYFGGFTHRQIAARLGLPEGTVKGRMRLGLNKLRGDVADIASAPDGPLVAPLK